MNGVDNGIQQDILLYLIHDAQKKLSKKRRPSVSESLGVAFADLEHHVRRGTIMSTHSFHTFYIRCHELYGLLGGAITEDHWQSPSYASSVETEAGDESRSIIANVNDYKRDVHPIGIVLEQSYAAAYPKRQLLLPPLCLATVSGMAALSVALVYAASKRQQPVRIAVGEHSYFENKELVRMLFGSGSIVWFDERNPEVLLRERPDIILFDAVSNDPALTVADVSAMYGTAARMDGVPYVVVDASAAMVSELPLHPLVGLRFRLMVFESLNKYHQFGLDRVTGGILTLYGIPHDDVYTVRDHLGVNMPEQSAASIPTPSKSLMKRYMNRLRINTRIVTERLQGLRGVSVNMPVQHGNPMGTFVSVQIPSKSSATYRKIIRASIRYAQERTVPLLAGTTFGTPITRIYTWSTRSEFERPYLRISPGLETQEAIDQVADVIGLGIRSVVPDC